MLLALLVLLADAASLMAAGDKAYAAKDFRTALFAYQDATREDPSSAIVLVKLGETYARMGHDPEAIEQFQRALKLDRGNSAALQGLAAARERLPILDQALEKKPGYGVALVARGSAHMGLLQYDAAAADYTAARAADPSLASPLFGLAEAYRALGQSAKAAEFYREYAASTAPDVQPQLRDYAARNAQALASP